MADSDPAILGVQRCGCVTLAIARPAEELDRESQDELMEVVREGGQIERTTVGGARRRKHFLPSACPHDPKGWGRDA